MLKHPTLDLLHQLGLAGMAQAFAELAANDEAAGLGQGQGQNMGHFSAEIYASPGSTLSGNQQLVNQSCKESALILVLWHRPRHASWRDLLGRAAPSPLS